MFGQIGANNAASLNVIILTFHRLHAFQKRANTPAVSDDDILTGAVARLPADVKSSAFVPWKFSPKNADFEPSPTDQTFISNLAVQVGGANTTTNSSSVDESYTLDVGTDGSATVTANTAIGALHGMSSFIQLFYAHSDTSAGLYTNIAPVSIQDSPVYSHRGLNLDISRNADPPALVKKIVDSVAFNKFSRLHLHASDAQSWPLEIPTLPDLANKGAYQSDLQWTVADLEDVQSYGALRGVQVYLEIDTPGHTSAVGLAYPDLITAFNQQPWQNYSAEPPSGQLKLNDDAVTTFITTLFNDLLPRSAPYSPLFHTGGDELNANVYGLDPNVNSVDPVVIAPYLQAFIDHAHSLVRAQGLTPVVWDGLVLPPWNLTLGSDTIIQVWQDQDALDTVTALERYPVLFGTTEHWYLDCGYGQWLDPAPPVLESVIAPPYADYCNPQKSWREIYSYDPVQNYTGKQKETVIGGEVHMWGELTDPVNAEGKIWPRASAAAEIMWSGTVGQAGVNEGVTRRLAEFRERLVARGVTGAAMVQMTWCLQNPGDCTL